MEFSFAFKSLTAHLRGHALFTLYEMITGRKANEKFLEYAQIAGMILLLGLMLYANGNDWFGWGKTISAVDCK